MSSIKEFEIQTKLGEGSFAQVYRVKRISDGKIYAMKKVKMSLLSAKEKENALNEIRILASLSCQNIVQYKDSFLDPESNILCIIMEFASGGDLTKLVESGKLKGGVDEPEIWRVLVQLVLGLKNLHDLKILHRDLKCANVFVTSTPQGNLYKLGDLNISKVTKGANAKTQAGTPYYAAAEVWRGEAYSSPCDLWSLGCIIYELAASKPPFRANDLQGLNQKIQKGLYDPLPSKYSKDLNAMIAALLKVIPSQRPTCIQLLNNPAVVKNSGTLLINAEDSNTKQDQILQTIKLPKNLIFLKGNLPKAKYDDEETKNSRASSAGPRKIEDYSSTPQVEKKSVQVLQQVQQQQQVVKPQQQQVQGKPPMQQQKPPIIQQQQKDYAQLLQKIQVQEQKVYGAPSPSNASQQRNSNPRLQSPSRQQQQYQQQKPAGCPSGGMGKRQYSANQLRQR